MTVGTNVRNLDVSARERTCVCVGGGDVHACRVYTPSCTTCNAHKCCWYRCAMFHAAFMELRFVIIARRRTLTKPVVSGPFDLLFRAECAGTILTLCAFLPIFLANNRAVGKVDQNGRISARSLNSVNFSLIYLFGAPPISRFMQSLFIHRSQFSVRCFLTIFSQYIDLYRKTEPNWGKSVRSSNSVVSSFNAFSETFLTL